jgi:SOS-response transcriptional repressor LexA
VEAAGRRRAEPQLRLVSIEEARVNREAFKTLLPLYSLKAAAGYFGNGEGVEPESWIEADGIGKLDERMFVAKVDGRSMEPRIFDGEYCVFRANRVGSRHGKIVLVQYRGPADPDNSGSFTVKRYSSEKVDDGNGGWKHTKITLSPLNSEFEPIELAAESEDEVKVIAEFITVLGRA